MFIHDRNREDVPPLRRQVSLARQRACNIALAFLTLISYAKPARAWGNRAHRMVNAAAIENLPEPLRAYFRARQAYLVEHASDPDLLALENPQERSHHYTDAEAYDRYPFPRLRKQFVEGRRMPTPAQLRNGDSIWQIERYARRLAEALRRRQWDEADLAAVFLAHYACDLTQPLHTVVNYDGQFTGQAGIHARFETELVEASGDGWVLKPRPASNETDPRARIFRELLESYGERNRVLLADRSAVARRTYVDPRYLPAFAALAGPLAEKRLEAAVSFVSSLWYTAWVSAGKPRMPR